MRTIPISRYVPQRLMVPAARFVPLQYHHSSQTRIRTGDGLFGTLLGQHQGRVDGWAWVMLDGATTPATYYRSQLMVDQG